MKCWGEGKAYTPKLVSGVADAVEVTVGAQHGCARVANGNVMCWGNNDFGQLGILGEIGEREPRIVPGLSSTVQIVSGADFSCARANGAVWCWGVGGGFGVPTDTPRSPPTRVAFAAMQQDIAAGYWNTCGRPVGDGSSVECLGASLYSQIAGAARVTMAAQISIGWNTMCARLIDGDVACWGRTDQLGFASTNSDDSVKSPLKVPGIRGALQIASGAAFSCALLSSGEVVCWGSNAKAQLGKDASRESMPPVVVPGIVDAEEISLGGEHACARRSSGEVVCWGSNEYGELGIGDASIVYRPTPTAVLDLP